MVQQLGRTAARLVQSPQHLSNTHATSQTALAIAAKHARLLLGSSRTGEANDPEVYTAAIIAILSHYPEEVMRAVSDPYSGLTSKVDWLPKPKEVKEACEAEAQRIHRLKELGPPIEIQREGRFKHQHWATVFVPSNTPPYADMVAKASDPKTDHREFRYDTEKGGIWVIRDWLSQGEKKVTIDGVTCRMADVSEFA